MATVMGGPGQPPGTGDTAAATTVVWIGDGLVDPARASVRFDDHGLTVGDGVFETVKVTGDAPFALQEHLDRLERSASGLAMTLPQRSLIAGAAMEVARRWGELSGPRATARLRITVTTGSGPAGSERVRAQPTLMVTASALTLTREPTGVVVVPWTRNERGALAGLKTTSYAENVIALARARESGASEAIFANTRGELCEGTGTNVFVEHDGALATPPLSSGCLDGITRALLIDALRSRGVTVTEAPLAVASLAAANEAFLTSTGREVQPIATVDAEPLPDAPGPLTRAAMEAWDTTYT